MCQVETLFKAVTVKLEQHIIQWVGLYHVGVVSPTRGTRDYQVVHNIGYGARDEDVLREWTIIGHYRW